MATLLDIRTAIGLRLQDPNFQGVASGSVDQCINDAVDYYKKRRYWFNESAVTLNFQQGVGTITGLPADFYRELDDGLSYSYSNMVYPVRKVDSPTFDALNLQGVGLPYAYVYRNNAFEFYFLPQDTFPLTIRYLRDQITLVAPTDTNDFTLNAALMVRYNALSRIYAEFKQDSAMESYYTAKCDDEERDLLRRSNSFVRTGRLTLSNQICN